MTLVKQWQILKSELFKKSVKGQKQASYSGFIDYDDKEIHLSINIAIRGFKLPYLNKELKEYLNKYKIVKVIDIDFRKNYLLYKWDVFKQLDPIDIIIDFIKIYYNDDGCYNEFIQAHEVYRYNLAQHSKLYKYIKTKTKEVKRWKF